MSTDRNLQAVLPRGVKDFLPARAARIDYLRRRLLDHFRSWGFSLVLPAGLEHLDVLDRGLGPGLGQTVVRFDDRQSGHLVAIPPDITPQIARIAATRMQDLPLPYRLCYSGRVLRHAEQQSGKEREIYQAGVELIGLPQAEADAEMIAMVVEALRGLGAEGFTVDIGQVEFVRALIGDLDLPPGHMADLRDLLGRKDSAGLNALLETLPIDSARKQEISALPRLFGPRDILERARAIIQTETAVLALDNLEEILATLDTYQVSEHILFDLGELRGLDYHTGVTFQAFLPGMGDAVCSGGRYDNLTASYGRDLPATGFTFNVTHLLFALEKGLDAEAKRGFDVLLFQPGTDKSLAQRLAAQLRERGFSAARDSVPRSLEESIDYARQAGFRFVMTIKTEGDTVGLIRTADRSQQTLDIQDIGNGKIAEVLERS
ncbi:MAG: ATP phosphoribosyltransferase regulatory subunit [Deltaproteobacteria bacterium]|nr:MAG: ATP phosphoribosyltransferase regulatory subunit [Deltaproteobacteria bacterium]